MPTLRIRVSDKQYQMLREIARLRNERDKVEYPDYPCDWTANMVATVCLSLQTDKMLDHVRKYAAIEAAEEITST